MVALFQFTYVGAPMMYYGTEAGMWGADDPCDRMPMVWPGMQFDPQQADPRDRDREPCPVGFDQTTFAFYRAAIELRKKYPCLRHGGIEFFPADDEARFLAFERRDTQDRLLVGFNRGAEPYAWRISSPAGSSVAQIFTASGEVQKFALAAEGESTVVTVPPLEAVVLRVAPAN